MPLPTTVTPSDSLRAFAIGPELLTAGTGVSAGLATYMEMLPVKSYKNDLQDTRLVTQEMIATLVRDTATVRLYKRNDVTYSAYSRFDKNGWLLRNAIGTPTSVAAGSTSTNCVQTVTLGSTGANFVNGELFTLSIGGYTTTPITFSSVNATLLAAVVAGLASLPSVVTAATTGAVNIAVLSTSTSATTSVFNLSCGTNLSSYNLPLIGVSTNSAIGAAGVVNSTPGVGSYKHTFVVGASGKLPSTYGEYDGISYKRGQSGAIDSLDLAATMTDAPLWQVKAISQAEVDYSTMAMMSTASFASVFPNYFFSQYTNTMDPTQLTFNIGGTLGAGGATITGGTTNSTVLDLKLSGKNNRKAMNAMGGASGDMIRATEGVVSWAGTCKLRYATTYTASQYANYVTNTAPGQFILMYQDANTFIGAVAGAANHPTMSIVIPNPKWEQGTRMPDTAEPELDMGFRALWDQGTQTSMTIVLVNETPRYTTLT